ncbi:replicative DNA helicase [Prochlorothrix hollandica]|nr:replicative DNA helicase [Prochlorothrix hollandica]
MLQQDQSFQPLSDHLPPQIVEAEEAILGSILLDPDAITRIAERLKPEAFYISAHQEIYRMALRLSAQGKPTDLTTLAAWLQDEGKLDKVGGQGRLAQLVDRTISTANVDQYAELVLDKYLRRQLIQGGNEIIRLGYDTRQPLEQVLDKAQQQVFNIAQHRPQGKGLTATSSILTTTFNEIEQRSTGKEASGIACNFYDLDAMTQGFQRSDLVIVAGRPSMGKTSFVLNIARSIAFIHKQAVCVFSLEMSKEQLIYRLLSSESGIESGRLRTGRVREDEWSILGRGINTLSELPIFIDDTPDLTVMDMRSKARRLSSEHNMQLGLVLIDYLQLMEGVNPDNRVQELSKITRALKGMARELNVPVITLSQLSRGVESRTNKRPMMSDLRESGSIEQDADLIIMLYRDEYYNPDTPDRGITEVIITKHRNGPTGTVKLLFEPQYTRFRNLAAPHS